MMTIRTSVFALLAALALAVSSAAWAQDATCGGPDAPCTVPLGSYNIALPADWDGVSPLPAVLHFHGAGGSGRGVIRNTGFVTPILARGYAVIAPTGLPRPGRNSNNWSVADGSEPRRDELAFARQVLADAETRFHIDPARVLVSGFSRGASLVWDLACSQGAAFTAYAPVAGAFWEPMPTDCPGGPVDLLHVHGFVDTTVPLEGRPLRSGRYQGDVFAGLTILRRADGCDARRPDDFVIGDRFSCRIWNQCSSGHELEFCLHDGSHGVPQGWPDLALDWFEHILAERQALLQ